MNNLILKRVFFVPFILLVCAILSGCSAALPEHQKLTPKLDLFSYFNGNVTAWGMVQDFKGNQIRRFEVKIKGEITGNKLTLTEDFVYADGEKSQRIWYITKDSENQYTGTAADVIGEAKGTSVGNALRWQYTLSLPVDDDIYEVQFDDWMFLQDQHHLFNKATMSKLGITVAEVTLFFQKQP